MTQRSPRFQNSAPKGEFEMTILAASLKQCPDTKLSPDTNLDFYRRLPRLSDK